MRSARRELPLLRQPDDPAVDADLRAVALALRSPEPLWPAPVRRLAGQSAVTADANISIQQYVDTRLTAIERMIDTRFTASERAIDTAEQLLREWKHTHNEFRDQINKERETFATQAQVARLQQWVDVSGGRWQALTVVTGVLTVITLLITLGRVAGFVK